MQELLRSKNGWIEKRLGDIAHIQTSSRNRAIETLPEGIKNNREAIAETIENNVRSKIVKTSLSDPAYYETMSALLDEIITARKEKAIDISQ